MSFDIIEELRESYYKFGPIHKVVETQFGIASGNTRLKAVPEWPRAKVNVPNYYDHLRIMAASNIHAPKPKEWWEKVINEAAEELKKQGLKPGEISDRLATDFPLSRRTIMLYLHEEYKNPKKVMAAKKSRENSAATVAAKHGLKEVKKPKSSDFSTEEKLEIPMISDDQFKRIIRLRERMLGSTVDDVEKQYLKTLTRDEADDVIRELENNLRLSRTEESIKQNIHSPVSRVDVEVPMKLNQLGINNFTTQEPICVYQLIPDLLFPDKKIMVFFDGPGHKHDDLEFMMRESMRKRGWRVLELEYERYSKETVQNLVQEILDVLGVEWKVRI